MQDKKNVYMILTNGFNPDVRVYKEAKYLVKQGLNVTILCWDRKCEFLDKCTVQLDGITIKRFPVQSKPGTGMKQLLAYFKFMKKIRKYLKDKEYTYLHCHDFDGILIGLFTKHKKGKKIIFDMHEIYDNYSYAKVPLFHYFLKRIIRKTDYIIYVNEEQIKNINEKEKLIFLPNYPELEIYMPIEKENSDKLRVNYVGSLRDYESLKALTKLGENKQDIEVGLYGDGICFEKLKDEYQNSKIRIYGKYNGILESGKIYRNTDILYCSYNPEIENWKNAYPVKLFEAIITLTPIIVSTGTTAGNFVSKEKIGEQVKFADIESITKAIIKISNNYEKYVQKLKKITNKYIWENIVKNLDNIYRESEGNE